MVVVVAAYAGAMLRVLVVDDDFMVAKLHSRQVAATEDCAVVGVAHTGADALRAAERLRPDLLLLDIMMPKLSGFEVCKKLKGDAATRNIMVLMVTALNELGDIERAIEAGTDDFLSKPVNKIELVKRVENMLTIRIVKDEVERLRQYIQRMEDDAQPG